MKPSNEEGRRLASQREDLIAQGADPADLLVPLAPTTADDTRAGEVAAEEVEGLVMLLADHSGLNASIDDSGGRYDTVMRCGAEGCDHDNWHGNDWPAHQAQMVLASNWLAAHDARVRAADAAEIERLRADVERFRPLWASPLAPPRRWVSEPIPYPRRYVSTFDVLKTYGESIRCSSDWPKESRWEAMDRALHSIPDLAYEIDHLRSDLVDAREDRDLRATQVDEALSILEMVKDRVDDFVYDEFSSVLEDGPCDHEHGDVIPSPLRAERDRLAAGVRELADEWAAAHGRLGVTINDLVQHQCAARLRALLGPADDGEVGAVTKCAGCSKPATDGREWCDLHGADGSIARAEDIGRSHG